MKAKAVPTNLREQIGKAVLLYGLFMRCAPREWDGDVPVWLPQRYLISDADIAADFGVSQGTAARWRCRLRAVGVAGWLEAPAGRLFWISNANLIFGWRRATNVLERKETGKSSAPDITETLSQPKNRKSDTEPLASRFVQ